MSYFFFKLKAVRRFLLAQKLVSKNKPAIKKEYSFKDRITCLLHGFTTDKLVWYGFKEHSYRDYISDYDHYCSFEAIDRQYYYVANDKLVCERMVGQFCRTIPTIGIIIKGEFFPIGNFSIGISSWSSLLQSLDSGKEFYLKPNNGGSGRGVGKLWKSHINGKECILFNNQQIEDPYAFVRQLDDYLVQERFLQKGFSHSINPDTLNTLRIATMMDPENGKPFIGYACHRFGRKGAFVDNIAQANILCPIDISTGTIKYAVLYPLDGKMKRTDFHPDTGKRIAGTQVPHWNRIINLCKELAVQLPFLPLCGWDVILSGDEVYIQELNYNPDIYLGQIDSPMLLNEQVKLFYLNHKIK